MSNPHSEWAGIQRKCSLCGGHYMDGTGHDYDLCVTDLEHRVARLQRSLYETEAALTEAVKRRDRGVDV